MKKTIIALLIGSLFQTNSFGAVIKSINDNTLSLQENFYQINVDDSNKNTNELQKVFEVNGQYYMSEHDLNRYQVKYAPYTIIKYKGENLVLLNDLGTIKCDGSVLKFHINPLLLPNINYNFQNNLVKAKRKYTNSAFMNYSISTNSQSNTQSITNSIYKTFSNGVLYNLNTSYLTNSKHGFSLIDAYREQYFPSKLTVLRFGTANTGYNSLINSIPFFGIQYKKNFSLDPNNLSNPYLSVNGTADTKSIADLYVNSHQIGSIPINAGPYTFSNLTAGQTSANQVEVVIKDLNGNVLSIQNVSLIGEPYNLKKGEDNFDYDLGLARNGYGGLGSYVADGTYAYGITNNLTIEGHGESTRGQSRVSGNITYASPFGTFQYGAAIGKGEHLQKFQANYQNGNFYGNISVIRSSNFHIFGNTNLLIPNQTLVTAGYNFFNTSIGFSIVKYGPQEQKNVFSLSRNFYNTNISLSLTKQGNDKSIFLTLNIPLGSNSSSWRSNSSYNHSSTQGTTSDLNLSRTGGQYNDWNMGLDYQTDNSNKSINGNLQYTSQYGLASFNGSSSSGNNQYNLGYNGSLVFDHGIIPSQSIYQGYALVNTNGTPNIPISINNQLIAKTNNNGYAVVPNTYSNMDNNVAVITKDLPPNIEIDDSSYDVSPQNYFKADVNFNVKKNPVLLLPNISLKGIDSVKIDGNIYYTVNNGIYFNNYKVGEIYVLRLPNCVAKFSLKGNENINQTVPLVCSN